MTNQAQAKKLTTFKTADAYYVFKAHQLAPQVQTAEEKIPEDLKHNYPDYKKDLREHIVFEEDAKAWVHSIYNSILSKQSWGIRFGGESIDVNGVTLKIAHHQKLMLDTIKNYTEIKNNKLFLRENPSRDSLFPYTELAERIQTLGEQAHEKRDFFGLRTRSVASFYQEVKEGVQSKRVEGGRLDRESMSDVSRPNVDRPLSTKCR